jgi:hypothetical protein
MPVGSIAS